ncbi:MAG: hypothetical protein ABIV94_12350 [Acidimicrobiales bacterium]
MKQVIAAVVAVGMVVASVLVRSRLDDGTGGANGGGGRRAVVVCVTELAEACQSAYGDSVELRIEEAATTAKVLASGDGGIDDWITLDVWTAAVAAKGGGPALDVTLLASTPLVIAAVKERVERLTCAGEGWRCVLDAAGKQWSDLGGDPLWGRLRVGLPRTSSATGLALDASAIVGLAGTTDVGTNDDAYTAAQLQLGRAERDGDALGTFLRELPAGFSAVGTLQADAARRSGVKADQVMVIPLVPPGTAIAVVARVGDGAPVDVSKVAKALGAIGWDTSPATDNGLVDAGVLLALSGI